jgi:RimJ/RimL family protein N-acetyltransferase
MPNLTTDRLIIRPFTLADAPFVLELVNSPGWLTYIGDRGIYSLADTRNYLSEGPLQSYAQHGFGLYLVALADSETSIGMCGLLRRETLPDVDIGFAFLPAYAGQGYAFEAATAVLDYGYQELQLSRIIAVTMPENRRSRRLLEKLEMKLQAFHPALNREGDELIVYARGRPRLTSH